MRCQTKPRKQINNQNVRFTYVCVAAYFQPTFIQHLDAVVALHLGSTRIISICTCTAIMYICTAPARGLSAVHDGGLVNLTKQSPVCLRRASESVAPGGILRAGCEQ
jgi:hypothetical protein